MLLILENKWLSGQCVVDTSRHLTMLYLVDIQYHLSHYAVLQTFSSVQAFLVRVEMLRWVKPTNWKADVRTANGPPGDWTAGEAVRESCLCSLLRGVSFMRLCSFEDEWNVSVYEFEVISK